MEEYQISVDGETYPLAAPYFVIATQNPIETQGTFPLPEAQLDRFLLQLQLGYPGDDESVKIMRNNITAAPFAALGPVCGKDDFAEMKKAVSAVFIHDDVYAYIAELAKATRGHEAVVLGISVRGAIALARLAQAYAALEGREFVTPTDVSYLMPYVFGHRIMLKGGLKNRKSAVASVLEECIANVMAPTEAFRGAN